MKEKKIYSAVISVIYVATVEADNLAEAKHRLHEQTIGGSKVDDPMLPYEMVCDGIKLSQQMSASGQPQVCDHDEACLAVLQTGAFPSLETVDALKPQNRKRLLARLFTEHPGYAKDHPQVAAKYTAIVTTASRSSQ